MRAAIERIFEQYHQFSNGARWRSVVSARHSLWTRWSDDAGNETTTLYVFESGDDGRIDLSRRFDEDDFEGAYRELERRYYAGEGAAFAQNGRALVDFIDCDRRARHRSCDSTGCSAN